MLAIGLLIAVCGWALDTQTEVISDVRELVPQDLQALKDVNELQHATGVSGEIDVTVRADDVTDPKVARLDGELPAAGARAARVQDAAPPARSARTRPSCARRCR